MSEKRDPAAAILKGAASKVKASGTRIYLYAKDPATRAKVENLVRDGQKIYMTVTSPEAKKAYRVAVRTIKKVRGR